MFNNLFTWKTWQDVANEPVLIFEDCTLQEDMAGLSKGRVVAAITVNIKDGSCTIEDHDGDDFVEVGRCGLSCIQSAGVLVER